jgi:hypothetical protein
MTMPTQGIGRLIRVLEVEPWAAGVEVAGGAEAFLV